ncbi:MFS transporter [Micromonospora sp. WMMD1120]|uniref:MFS transporter n=1 Tax=Micromonospora sp. WMMD1120 TaxID=3016106 RepID=UPI0024170F1C|nr:MFS transporter [Micromonospora sp. WMMD1120]MDG4810099.1 MFS transporter [Micromonospora sp. WMMD1120]
MAHPLRVRSFRLLFLGRTVSALGEAVVPAALALAVLRATGSTGTLAAVLAAAMVPRLLLLPLGGVVADRFDARRVALLADLVRCATQLAVGAQLLGGQPSLVTVVVASALGGTASAFAIPTASPLIAGTVEPAERQRANALMGITANTSRLAGPALAGALIWAAGPGWAFVLDSAAFALSAALLALVRVRHVPVPRRSVLADLRHGLGEVRSRDWFWSSLVGHGVWNGAAAVLMTLGPAVAIDQLGGETTWVLLLQAGAIGMLAGSLLAGRVRLRRPVLLANLGLACYAAPLFLLAVAAPAPAVLAAYAVAMTALGYLNPVWETVVQQHFPPEVLARVTSYDWLVSLGATPLGYALAPLAADAFGAPVPLIVAGLLVLACCAGTTLVPGVRRLTWSPAPQPQPAEPVGVR